MSTVHFNIDPFYLVHDIVQPDKLIIQVIVRSFCYGYTTWRCWPHPVSHRLRFRFQILMRWPVFQRFQSSKDSDRCFFNLWALWHYHQWLNTPKCSFSTFSPLVPFQWFLSSNSGARTGLMVHWAPRQHQTYWKMSAFFSLFIHWPDFQKFSIREIFI